MGGWVGGRVPLSMATYNFVGNLQFSSHYPLTPFALQVAPSQASSVPSSPGTISAAPSLANINSSTDHEQQAAGPQVPMPAPAVLPAGLEAGQQEGSHLPPGTVPGPALTPGPALPGEGRRIFTNLVGACAC